MPKWVTALLAISAAVITTLFGVVGFFSVRTLDSISDELRGVKAEINTMNKDYSRLSQSVAVMMAVNETHSKQCRFPETKQEKN